MFLQIKNKILKLLLVLGFFILIVISCDNDGEIPLKEEFPAKIIIGDILNPMFNYTTYTNRIYNSGGTDNTSIDINNDGIKDIKFVLRGGKSMGTGNFWTAYCFCLHDSIQVCNEVVIDSVYRSKVIQKISSSPVTYRTTTSYSCNKIDDSYILHSTTQRQYPIKFFEGDSLLIDYNFSSDTLYMSNLVGYEPMTTKIVNDTVFQSRYSGGITYCHNFPFNGIRFIGIKIRVNGMDYLGWIKLEFATPTEYCTYIRESAIQKPLDN